MNSSTCNIKHRTLLAVSLLTLSTLCQASAFKMVQLTAASTQTELPAQKFDDVMNRCVKLTALSTGPVSAQLAGQAQAACHQAVIEARYASVGGDDGRAMKAYAYTNRGVQKLKQQDKVGALEDFKAAVTLKADAITEHNLTLLTEQINRPDASPAD